MIHGTPVNRRNPFIDKGHFNAVILVGKRVVCRNPFIDKGHFNKSLRHAGKNGLS